jgi:cytoskeleton protein RodZ
VPDHDERDLETGAPVGDRLRATREAAGLSLDQVSARTRIRVPVLQDLEADRLGPATSAVYTRGHIRAIAAAVGVDPAPLVRDFDEQVGATAPTAAPVEPVPLPRPPAGSLSVPLSAPPDRPRWLQACVAGAGVLVALLAVGVLTDDGDEREQASGARAETTTAAGQAPAPAPAPVGAALVLEAHGTSWLSVSNAATTLFEGVVEDGWTQRFEDPSAVSVRVGNAAVVAAACGGATAGPEGEEGTVLTLTCTPTGLQRQ